MTPRHPDVPGDEADLPDVDDDAANLSCELLGTLASFTALPNMDPPKRSLVLPRSEAWRSELQNVH